MKYSLRSLMLAITFGPPVLGGLYLWVTNSVAWELKAFLIAWVFFFAIIAAYGLRKSPAALGIGHRPRSKCSFCKRPDLETGALAEGPGGVLICYFCIGQCKELIENECREKGCQPGDPSWYLKQPLAGGQLPDANKQRAEGS